MCYRKLRRQRGGTATESSNPTNRVITLRDGRIVKEEVPCEALSDV
jgi:hypothetical protein